MMQPIVVAAFHDAAAARAAADQLTASGVAPADLTLRRDTGENESTVALETDEVLTGGIITSFRHLAEALLSQTASIGDEVAYRAFMERGTLLTVKVPDSSAGQAMAARLQAAGAESIAMLPEPGLEQP
jgi:hypothetical protein